MAFGEILDTIRSSPTIRGIAASLLMVGILTAYSRHATHSLRWRWLLGLVASLIAALGLAVCLRQVVANFLTLRDWDYLCFWTYGRALALGSSPYDVNVLREIAAPLRPSAEFLDVNVCLYPPFCLPALWLFGALSFWPSMVAWFAVQIAAMIVSVGILRGLWDKHRTWIGLAVSLAIFLSWHSTQLTLLYGQTNFLFLLAILGVVLVRSPIAQGISLGLSIVIKPIAVILLIDALLRRQWRTLLAALAPPVIATALFILMQGWSGLMSYVQRDRSDIVPEYYEGTFNQSLMAISLRWTEVPSLANPILYPPYVAMAGFLTIASIAVLLREPKELAFLRIGYLLTLALLVYPGTQMYYSLWLLVPLAQLWERRGNDRRRPLAGSTDRRHHLWTRMEPMEFCLASHSLAHPDRRFLHPQPIDSATFEGVRSCSKRLMILRPESNAVHPIKHPPPPRHPFNPADHCRPNTAFPNRNLR